MPLKWDYTLSPGSNLHVTTFSIYEGSTSDIGFIVQASGIATVYTPYQARFNINTSEVATLIINRATEIEETTFQCKLQTSNQWRYRVRVKLTGKS